jgi:hypothetical protein
MWGKQAYTAAALVAALISGAAHAADWTAEKGEDPMTDRQFAVMIAQLGLGQGFGFKCFDNGEVAAIVILGPYNDAATYKTVVQARFRVDRNEPVEIRLMVGNAGGRLSYSASGTEALSLFKRVGAAKERIVITIETIETLLQVSAWGSAEAAAVLDKTCKLPTVILP